jgi:hypothetical protein
MAVRQRGAQVGVSSDDVDAQQAFVRQLDAKIGGAVAQANDPALAQQWGELHERVRKYLGTGMHWLYGSMTYMVGRVLIAQLQPWATRMQLDAGSEPVPVGTFVERAENAVKPFMPVSWEQAAFVLLMIYAASQMLKGRRA